MLEQQMAIVASEGQRTRAIVRCVDRDLADLSVKVNANTKVLNALRETQLEHGEKLREHDTRFDGLEARFDGLEARFDGLEARFDGLEREMRHGFSTVAVGMAQITALLKGIAGSERG